jgi:hypothetical protein
MSDKDAVNTIILTLFTCYCYKFKMKERHKFVCFWGTSTEIILERFFFNRIKYFEFEICTVQHIFNNVNTTICFVLLIIYNCCLHTRWTFILYPDITNQKVICRLLKTVWKMSSEDRFGRLSDAEMEKMMSDKDAVNTIILTLFTCYCYKFKIKHLSCLIRHIQYIYICKV